MVRGRQARDPVAGGVEEYRAWAAFMPEPDRPVFCRGLGRPSRITFSAFGTKISGDPSGPTHLAAAKTAIEVQALQTS